MAKQRFSKQTHIRADEGFPPEILTAFFEYFPDPLFVWDWKSGKLLRINRAVEKVFGYSFEEMRLLDSASLLPEGVSDRLPAILMGEQKNKGLMARTTVRCKSGMDLPVEIRTRLFTSGENTLRCMVARDLSGNDPLAAAGKLEDIAEFLPRIFEEQEMIFEINPDGFVSSANAISLRKTGYTRQDIREGIHFLQAILPEEREGAFRDFERLQRGERLDALEYTLLQKDGTPLPVILSLSPVTAGGEVHGVRGVALDISEHRRIEHDLVIREKLNLLGELTGGVVHNFNNILSVILGYIEILPLESMDDNGRRVIQNIRRAALDGTDIVHRIRSFSTPEGPAALEASDLNVIAREVLEYMKPRYTAADPLVTVQLRLQPVPPVMVTPFEIREVLSNIVINAFDAMPGGGVLTLATGERDGFVALTVTDTGVGMSKETRDRLFEPFFTTKGKLGTGIGMSVSFAIIGKFGGEIQVDSAPGRGTTITILLPRVTETLPAEPGPHHPDCAVESCSILVIDDEANICEILREYLSRAGHRVTIAQGSETALALLKDHTYDILITDLNMPGVSGWEIARHVRHTSPQTYIIMLTGWGTRIEEINQEENVVDYLLIKPISFSALSQVIAQASARG